MTMNAAQTSDGMAEEQTKFVNSADVQEYTPLFYAVKRENKEAARMLIANGADVNVKSWRGTPLHEAVRHGRLQCVHFYFLKLVLQSLKTKYTQHASLAVSDLRSMPISSTFF